MTVTARTHATAAWVFLRLLGLVYLCAFWSLSTQILGLLGRDGILPARLYMDGARMWAEGNQVGIDRFRVLPTLCWVSTSDSFLNGLGLAGIALAVLLMAGIAPVVVLPLLWLTYLSLSVVGRDFLSFQWDALLLEAGLLAIFIAPRVWLDRWSVRRAPPPVGVWLLVWLLFRLMLGSGVVKLSSGDPTWRSLTALTFHYETQPIPTPAAWYAHHLPVWWHKASTLVTFAIELAVPVFVFGSRRWRLAAFTLIIGLQALIAVTGNYAFFNLLTVSLCVFLLDDETLRPVVGADRDPPLRAVDALTRPGSRVRRGIVIAVAVVTVPVSAQALARSAGIALPGSALIEPIAGIIAPFRSVNGYGLFAIMTTTRNEIVLEGSEEGEMWSEYEFKYKPGDTHRRPPWVAPHQPRLDWQMWFAALGSYEDSPWFRDLCMRLLEGSPEVRRLLDRDPFDGRAPRYVRGVLYRYHFSDSDTRRREGVWWTRERLGEFSPTLALR
jgi:hypothetical protein